VSHKQTLKALSKVRETLSTQPAESPAKQEQPVSVDVATLRQGQPVFHRPWGKKAVVAEVDLRKSRVRIDMSGVFLWAEARDLAPSDARPETRASVTQTVSASPVPMRLDLRGMRADVALSELEKGVDNALLAGRSVLEIIHGRGTGALRKEVHAYLRQSPAIATFSLAPEDQGGDGVTLVEFR